MFGKKTTSQNIENAVSKAVNYEVSVADIAKRSEKRAWMVAWTAILMSLILAGGYFYMLPLKEKVPYLVMADAYTGTSTVARLRDNFAENSITASEAINRSNVSHFVTARESYDGSVTGEKFYYTVYTMSGKKVASGYRALHDPINPDQPFKRYGQKEVIRIKILNIGLKGADQVGKVPTGATVRFQRILYDRTTGLSRPMDGRVAELEFSYNNNLALDDEQRILNPLGFQVTSYNVTPDYSDTPPVDAEAAPVFYRPQVQPQPTISGVDPLSAPVVPDAQGNPMQPAGAPAPAVPQPQSPQVQPAQVPSSQQTPATVPPPNNTNGAATR
jgi:type IV secretion system protein VirB8